ncbi:hypothetical protein [Flavobacterium sp.]|uniref:hypothetical protein n=1 Tax=Flavobacterium sp. TaxID=239 RepID=UPI002B7FAAFB|nr:hypothetical protein [Flavobacterium sp.]HSD06359.1 hypothetical protein [Flavobacterium sp.]
MEILPYKKITLETKLEPELIIDRIQDSIEDVDFQFFRYGLFSKVYEKPFEGEIDGNEFEIQRLVNYKNALLPIMFGNIIRESNVTKIEIKMRPEKVACIALNVFAIIGLVINLSIFTKPSFKLEDCLFNLAFLLLPAVLYGFFWYECKAGIEELKDIIESEKNEC